MKVHKRMNEDPDYYVDKMHELNPDKQEGLNYPVTDASNLGREIIGKLFREEKSLLKVYKLKENEYLNKICLCSYVTHKAWRGEKIEPKALSNFILCIKNHLLLLSFPRLFESFRIMKKFEYSNSNSGQISELVMICLSECYNKMNVSVPLDLINLSSTFFCQKIASKDSYSMDKFKSQNNLSNNGNGFKRSSTQKGSEMMDTSFGELLEDEKERIKKDLKNKSKPCLVEQRKYLTEEIKSHKIFQKMKFWETCLIYSLKSSKDRFDFHDSRLSVDPELIRQNFISQISRTFMSLVLHMSEFGCSRVFVEDLMMRYFKKYMLPKKSVEELVRFIDSSYGGKRKKKAQKLVYSQQGRKESGSSGKKTIFGLLG